MSSDIGYEYAEHILNSWKFLVLGKVASRKVQFCVGVEKENCWIKAFSAEKDFPFWAFKKLFESSFLKSEKLFFFLINNKTSSKRFLLN